jgi:hypothetical protein
MAHLWVWQPRIGQDFKPRIHMTDSDFQSITSGLCGPDGTLGPLEFEAVMRRQIKQATQAKLALVGDVRSPEDLEFMQFGALKMLLLEQVDFRAKGEHAM